MMQLNMPTGLKIKNGTITAEPSFICYWPFNDNELDKKINSKSSLAIVRNMEIITSARKTKNSISVSIKDFMLISDLNWEQIRKEAENFKANAIIVIG